MRWIDNVALRPIVKSDLPILLSWRNDDRFCRYCSKRRNKLTEEELDEELRADFIRDRYRQVIIQIRKTGHPIGTMYAYGYSADDEYLFVTAFLENPRQNRGLGALAFGLFCRELFDELKLYKIYTDVYEHNALVLQMLRKAGLQEEGRFRGHRKEGVLRYDTIRLALYKETLERSFICRGRSQ